MHLSIAAAGLLGFVQHVAAIPASSPGSVTSSLVSSSSTAAKRPVVATSVPVAAADTNITIVDLGIAPAVLRIAAKPNPNFTPNVTNAIAAAQIKYVVLEEQLQLEKRRLDERELQKRANRPVIATRPIIVTQPVSGAASRIAGLNLPCSIYPQYCTATTTTTASATSSSTSATQATTSNISSSSSHSTTTTSQSSSTSSTLSRSSSTSSSAKSIATLASVAAQDIQLDSEYLSSISIGSNNNVLDVVFDTGSADLWMFSTDCVGCSSGHDFYNPSLSTTFVNTTTPFALKYGDGSTTSGLLAFDTVTVAGAPIQAQSIDVPHTISASLQSNSMDGIMGLGFPNLMSVQGVSGVTTPLTSMLKQGLISTARFGVQLIKDNQWSYSGGGGTWTFGGYDSSVISGSLNTVSLTRAQYYMVSLQGVSVGSAYSYTPSQSVIVDSGTTLILLDSTSVANIHKYLPGGRVSPDNSHYQIFCNASSSAYAGTRNAYFTLGGVKYGVPAADLAWYPESATPGYCYSGIQPWSNSFGILGVMFLKNVYAVFDQSNSAIELGFRTDVATLTD